MSGWSVPGVVHLHVVHEDQVGRRVLARHRRTRRSLAITYLSPELLADTEFRARFRDVCAELVRVREPRVARVHRYLECDHGAAVIGDQIQGTRLRSLLLAHGAMGTEAALVVLKDVLLALAACHEAGVAHGDVKPENVVLTPAGRVRLVDIGLWSASARGQLAWSTPFYLAPEQWSGPPASSLGDVYAATITFFECLVGAPPFYSDVAAELAAKHQGSAPPVEVVPEALQELVLRGLAKDPCDRPEARNLVGFLDDVASRGLDPGWERRGRRELVVLLANRASIPAIPVSGRRHGGAGSLGYLKPVRLAAVMGGALALAAGLASPPLAVIPGIAIFGSGDRPPVLAFPEPDRGAAAVRAVTNRPLTERSSTPATKIKDSSSVVGAQAPAAPQLYIHAAPDENVLPDGRQPRTAEPRSALSTQSTPAPPACTQRLMDTHQPCTAVNPEQPTPGAADTSDSSEVSIPVALPIPLPAPVQLPSPVQLPMPVQLPKPVQLPAPAQPSRATDIRIPKSLQVGTDSQLPGKTARTRGSDAIGGTAELPTSRSQKGSWSPKGTGNPGNG